MGFWHGVEYYEKERVVGDEFYQQWSNVSGLCRRYTRANFYVPPTDKNAVRCSQVLKENTRISYDWSFFMAWAGVGFSLVSAILFSGAAICLRGEREREEALNMQYLMPG